MLGIAEQQPFFNAALPQTFFYLRRDVDERPSGGQFEPEFFVTAFHMWILFWFFPIWKFDTQRSLEQPKLDQALLEKYEWLLTTAER